MQYDLLDGPCFWSPKFLYTFFGQSAHESLIAIFCMYLAIAFLLESDLLLHEADVLLQYLISANIIVLSRSSIQVSLQDCYSV